MQEKAGLDCTSGKSFLQNSQCFFYLREQSPLFVIFWEKKSRLPRRRSLDVKFPSSRFARRGDPILMFSRAILRTLPRPGETQDGRASQPRREASDYYFLRNFVLHVAHCCFIFFFSSRNEEQKDCGK